MRRPLACAFTLGLTVPVVLAALAAFSAAPAAAIDREVVSSGDTVLGEIRVPGEFDEFVTETPRGGFLVVTFATTSPGRLRPVFELVTDNFSRINLVGISPRAIANASPFNASGRVRLFLGSVADSVGGYRVKTKLKPAKLFTLRAAATDPNPATTLVVGVVEGWTLAAQIKSKGTAVTIASVTGPDGAEIDLGEPVVKGTRATFPKLVAPQFGDYTFVLDVPEGAVKWTLDVKLAGRLPKGATRDVRQGPVAPPRTLRLIRSNSLVFPVVQVVGERGAANDMGLGCSFAGPEPQPADERAACARIPLDASATPSSYRLLCTHGTVASITAVERGADSRIVGYTASSVRSSAGAGSSELTGIEYDEFGRAIAWTEVRTFNTTGRVHRLVVSELERFPNSAVIRSYRIEHTPPGAEPRVYDYSPVDQPNQ